MSNIKKCHNSNNNDNFDIQSISYSKLSEYYQHTRRIDLPIRKFVLITNLLREESPSNELEQHWFDTCIDKLDKEEEEEQEEQGQEQVVAKELEEKEVQQQQNEASLLTKQMDLYIHEFYHFRNNSGFLVCHNTISNLF
ncbi:MAG: hypothetical protein EXX96DRAFT_587030 [Benjaminiella poitrasii]|nr:MAG: hypothetical protein EXX96DRAFT_587030 [Benjaminiella poitrasii]